MDYLLSSTQLIIVNILSQMGQIGEDTYTATTGDTSQ